MTPEINKRLSQIELRVQYLLDIKEGAEWGNLGDLMEKVRRLKEEIYDRTEESIGADLSDLEETISFLEDRAEKSLTPDEIVRIVRNPQRVTLQNILENVYDSYTELGGMEDCNIDPSMVVAKATISRRVKGHVYVHQVMVIGHEKGHGEEFRNGGCTRPWGNEKAMRYMEVAETEGIPIHFYIFTPGAFPIEDYPGAAQQIARNLYALAKLRVPIVSLISEGGSGGAEAVGMSDIRLMLSHGYYSVISPEGAAAIEGKIKEGEKVPKDLLTFCAEQLSITARDNLQLKTIDRIVQEPVLGARRDDFSFLRQLRYEMIRATDEVVLKTKSFRTFRAYAIKQEKAAERNYEFDIYIRWELTEGEEERLLRLRSLKYRKMGQGFYNESVTWPDKVFKKTEDAVLKGYYGLRYGLIRHHHKQVKKVIEEVSGEGSVFIRKISSPLISAYDFVANSAAKKQLRIMAASPTAPGAEEVTEDWGDTYVSPLANEDRTVSCPNAREYGCLDLWVPDLYGEFCGVCQNCGHHFPLEYQWYLQNLFDRGSIHEFNGHIGSINAIGYQGFENKIRRDVIKTGRTSAMITSHARVEGISLIVGMLFNDFRNGTVGAAEGDKFVRACEKARIMRRPFLAYVHATGGIRIQEGTVGVVQMPKCTMAVREYIDSGGLYIVVYDNNSYAGPVASFLGCSPYQFAIRSSKIGFAGPRVIRETTGEDIPPDYHSAQKALARGHIQGIWDRREFRYNLYKCLLTMGGSNLYYR